MISQNSTTSNDPDSNGKVSLYVKVVKREINGGPIFVFCVLIHKYCLSTTIANEFIGKIVSQTPVHRSELAHQH